MKVILASKSPRRSELLTQAGIEFECLVSEEEEIVKSSVPREVVHDLSNQKAEAVYKMAKSMDEYKDEQLVVIGADTVVACSDAIMGKPKDDDDAKAMLTMLSGRKHSVWTGVTIMYDTCGKVFTENFEEETVVKMFDISSEEKEWYISTGESRDKAGAYAIQGLATRFIERIDGDYNNVVGLPVSKLYQKLKEIKTRV